MAGASVGVLVDNVEEPQLSSRRSPNADPSILHTLTGADPSAVYVAEGWGSRTDELLDPGAQPPAVRSQPQLHAYPV